MCVTCLALHIFNQFVSQFSNVIIHFQSFTVHIFSRKRGIALIQHAYPFPRMGIFEVIERERRLIAIPYKKKQLIWYSFFSLSDIIDLRHQSSAMCIIMLGEKTHTRGLQRKKGTPYQPLYQ